MKDCAMKILQSLALAAAVSFSAAAFAQTPKPAAPAATPAAAPATTPAATTAPATGKKGKAEARQQRTAKSLECSKQADTQNIHGKARRTFMNKCKKA
jgi:hypothetical protein